MYLLRKLLLLLLERMVRFHALIVLFFLLVLQLVKRLCAILLDLLGGRSTQVVLLGSFGPTCALEIGHGLLGVQNVAAEVLERVALFALGQLTPDEVLATLQVLGLIDRAAGVGWLFEVVKELVITHLVSKLVQELVVLRQVLAD